MIIATDTLHHFLYIAVSFCHLDFLYLLLCRSRWGDSPGAARCDLATSKDSNGNAKQTKQCSMYSFDAFIWFMCRIR